MVVISAQSFCYNSGIAFATHAKRLLFYTNGDAEEKLQRAIGGLQRIEDQHAAKLHQSGAKLSSEKLHQDGGEFPLPFALVPWRHHVEIITKCKSIDEALFYVGKTIEQINERKRHYQIAERNRTSEGRSNFLKSVD